MKKLLLLMWLPLLIFLYPLPPQRAAAILGDTAAATGASLSAAASQVPGFPTITEADRKAYVSDLWSGWFWNVGLLLGGVLIWWLAQRNQRYWQVWATGWGVFFLSLVACRYIDFHRHIPPGMLYFASSSKFVDLLQVNWALVMAGIDFGEFGAAFHTLYREFILPICELAVLGWLFLRNRTNLMHWLSARLHA